MNQPLPDFSPKKEPDTELGLLRLIADNTTTIKRWIVFFGVVTLLGVIVAIFAQCT